MRDDRSREECRGQARGAGRREGEDEFGDGDLGFESVDGV